MYITALKVFSAAGEYGSGSKFNSAGVALELDCPFWKVNPDVVLPWAIW